ncbi:MAG: SurA N-terminal domain-containing protein [Thermodesulfobacteriota bacterium]
MKTIGYIILLIAVSANAALSAEKLVDRIVAEVDNEIITYKELEKEIQPFVEKIKAAGYDKEKEKDLIEEARGRMLRNLIDEKISEIAAKKSDIEISEDEIKSFSENIKNERNLTDEEFKEALKKEGVTPEQYKERLKKQILKRRLIDYEVRSKIVITNEDIKEYYENHPEKYADEVEYEIWHVTFPKSSYEENSKEDVMQIAEQLRENALQKNNFKDISNNIDEYVTEFKALSGNIGFYKKEDLSSGIQEIISGLDEKEISSPVKTSRGIQLFYLSEIKTEKNQTLEEATPQIRRELYNKEVEKRFESWIEDLKKDIHISIID